MALTRYWAGMTLRRKRRELLGVVILLGLLGGLALFATAGARRTQSSYPRFLRASHASTMAVDPGQYDPKADAAIAHFPEVARSSSYVAFNTGPMLGDRPDLEKDFETLGTFDGRFFTMDRFAPILGRMPRVDRVDEVAMNEESARRYRYRVGQHIDLGTYTAEQTSDPSFFENPPPPKMRVAATIVAIGAFTDEVVQDDTNRTPLMLVTPAFSKQAAPYAGYAWQGLTLRRGDADVDAVKARYMATVDPGTPQFFRVTSVDTFHAEQAVRPLSLALALFGVIAGIAALVLVSQEVGRQLRSARADHELLRALGVGPAALARAALAGPCCAVALGTIVAIAVAYAASPLMPLGAARRVEVSAGLDADWTVLAGIASAIFVVLLVAAAWSAWRQLPHRHPSGRNAARPSAIVGAAASAGLSPAAISGLRFAFEPGDRSTAVPLRSVMVAAVVAVGTLVAALTFGSSFTTLLRSPSLYGWNWDAAVYDQSGYGNINLDDAHHALDGRKDIAGWSGAYFGADSIDGRSLPLLGMNVGSTVVPPILTGRMIRSATEVVLGSATADALGRHVGDDVRIGIGDHRATLHVVGTATLPAIGISHGAHTSLGVGALVVPDLVPGFDRQSSGNGPAGSPPAPVGPPVIFVRYVKGADASSARTFLNGATKTIGQYPGSAVLLGAQRPAEIVNSSDVGGAPTLLAYALGIATAASLAVALGGSVRRRRRELALLLALGFTRRQLAASIAWQATATIVIALLVGIPAGIVLGRTLWTSFAHQLDVVPHATVPVAVIAIVSAAALLVANLAAAGPAGRARRVRPAIALRNE